MNSIAPQKLTKDLIITGEAVALPIYPASLGILTLSIIVDMAAVFIGNVLSIFSAFLFKITTSSNEFLITVSVTSFFWMLIVPLTVETVTGGVSLGGLVTNTRVVRDDGGSVRFRHVLIRSLVGIFELWSTFGTAAIISAMISKRSKRLGDFLAGTYVVSQPLSTPRMPLVMPPVLANWANGVEVQQMPNSLSVAVRSFLELASSMSDLQRKNMGMQLTGEVMPFVFPAPPDNTHPELFLAAVMVLRRDKEYFQLVNSKERISKRDPMDVWGIPLN